VGENPAPALIGGQLLRRLDQLAQKVGNVREHACCPSSFGVRAGDPQRCLPRMAAALCNGGQEQRPAGDRFQMLVRFGEAHEQVPPVVDERDEAGHGPAAGKIAGGKASPAPLVLQFIEGILAIGAVAVELGERENLLVEGSNEHTVFVGLRVWPDLNEAERQLAGAPGPAMAMPSFRRRRKMTTWRWRLQPSSLNVSSLPCQP